MNKKGSTVYKGDKQLLFAFLQIHLIISLKQLQKLKETEKRNFSSKMAEFILEGVNNSSIEGKRNDNHSFTQTIK